MNGNFIENSDKLETLREDEPGKMMENQGLQFCK